MINSLKKNNEIVDLYNLDILTENTEDLEKELNLDSIIFEIDDDNDNGPKTLDDFKELFYKYMSQFDS